MKEVSRHTGGILRGLCLSLIFFLVAFDGSPPAHGESGRNFSGFLSVTDIVDAKDKVNLSLSLRIVNHSGVDVTQATLRLEHGFPGTLLYEFPMPIDIPYRGATLVTLPVLIVPTNQFKEWTAGRLPQVSLILTQNGQPLQSQVVELVPMRVERYLQP